MNLKRKDLVISIIMLVVFLVIGMQVSVLATSGSTINFQMGNNTANNSVNQIPQTNTTPTPNATPTNNANTSNTTVPNTGLTGMPWLIIGVCAVSAVFAYKKIKEYNVD